MSKLFESKILIPPQQVSFVLLFIIPIVYILQGIDFTDTGFVLTYYQQIFNDPSSVLYWFHTWLPNVIGGIWNILFGWGGILSFKLAAVLIFWLTSYLIYRTYHTITIQKQLLLFALLLGMVLHFPTKVTIIHYNNVSMLFLTLGSFLLSGGITKKSRFLLFCSGSALILAAFARLPNITAMSFVLLILYSGIIEKEPVSGLLKDVLAFLSGVLITAALVIAFMKILGHLQLYLDSVTDLFSLSSEDLSKYDTNVIIKRFFRHWLKALFTSAVVFIAAVIMYLASRKKPKLRISFFMAAFICTGIFSFFSGWQRSDEFIVFPAIGFIALTCIFIFILYDANYKKQKFLSLVILLLICVLSVGSDTGMTVGAYAIIFGLPLVFWFWYETSDTYLSFSSKEKNGGRTFFRQSHFHFSQQFKRSILGFVIILYGAYAIPFFIRDVYRDNSNRLKMTAMVNHPSLRGVFTTPERADSINSLLPALDKYVKKDDYLLTFDSIPMVFFLTKTRPYLYNPWPILYSPDEFQRAMEKARHEHPVLPVTVLAKVQMRSKTWPDSGGVSNYESVNENRGILFDFLEEEGYSKIWENNAFEILIPPDPLP